MRLIDAENYIKDLQNEMYAEPSTDYECGYNKALKRAVVLTHASDADFPKKGHWEHYSQERPHATINMIRCSDCGASRVYFGRIIKFCENCGCDMRTQEDQKCLG